VEPVLGLGLAEAEPVPVVPGDGEVVALPPPGVPVAEPVGLVLGEAVVLPVAVGEGLVELVDGLADVLPLAVVPGVCPEEQTVGNGSDGVGLAAMAGAAAKAPAVRTATALGTAIAVIRRRERTVGATDHSCSVVGSGAAGAAWSERAACSMIWVFSPYSAAGA
jgi:hypothetical protein